MSGSLASKKLYTLLTLSIIFILLLPITIFSSPKDPSSHRIKKRIQEKKETIKKEKLTLQKLTAQEKKLYSRLAATEKRIDKLDKRLEAEKDKLKKVKNKKQDYNRKFLHLQDKIQKNKHDLLILLKKLWPIYLQRTHSFSLPGSNWPEVNRNFVWLSSVYMDIEQRFELLGNQKKKLYSYLSKQKELEKQITNHYQEIEKLKDRLLQDKLVFLHKLQKVRSQQLLKEKQLAQIRKTIDSLEYKLKTITTKQIKKLKGYLPWPAEGQIIFDYDQKSNPPREGIGFSLASKTPVKSVSWGKVVYNDLLRGFGQVVIIYHGQKYYSLYAYLSQTKVKIGQEVEKGQVVGLAGFYPQSKGPGLYFELRNGKQPINPRPWLISKS